MTAASCQPFCRDLCGVCISVVLLLVFPKSLDAGGGPENVAVVVNAKSWASLAVANAFVHLRKIPAANVIYITDAPIFEQIGVDGFRNSLLKPVLQTIETRGLAGQIDYLVYSSDLPHAIDLQRDIGNRRLPKIITPVGSVTGLTYLYGGVMAGDLSYLSLQANRYMRRRLSDVEQEPLTDKEQIQFDLAQQYAKRGRWADAARTLAKLVEAHPDSPSLNYRFASMRARQGRNREALSILQRAVEAGWSNVRYTEADPNLAGLRREARFKLLLDRMRKTIFDVQPTHGFRGVYGWNEQGEIGATGGQRYLLSTMLAVTSGRGNSVSRALDNLRRSVAADGTRPTGSIYYMQRPDKDVRTEARREGFASAVAVLRSLGVRAVIQKATLPHGRHDVMGLMTGSAYFKWQFSSNTIQPGAICENLTSLGGYLQPGRDQTPLTHLLRYGAAGSSGTVTEPYAIPEKFPHPFLHVHYARGCSLAEAFYQSVHGPYQLLIVGDPLCRPWARIPEVRVAIGRVGPADEGRVVLKPTVAEDEEIEIAHFELFLNGRRQAVRRPDETFNLDTSEFPDGYHEVRVVAVTNDAIKTQGHAVSGFVVDHHGHKVTIEPSATTIAWDQPLHVKVELPGAERIAVLQNLRELASHQGESGRFKLDPRRMGLGPVRLQALGEIEGTTVMSPPVEVRVVAPDALPAVAIDDAKLKKGLLLRPDGSAPVVINNTQPLSWLSRAGVEGGQAFELTGVFNVPKVDVYQFQFFTDCTISSFEVDRTALKNPARKRRVFRPMALAKGTHQVRLKGTAGPNRRLDIRFGGPGCMPVAAPRFKHLAVE